MFKKNVANSVNRVKFKGTMIKLPVEKHHLEQHETLQYCKRRILQTNIANDIANNVDKVKFKGTMTK